MPSEPQDQPQDAIELDRRAWNLPGPPVAPAGPVRDVWPVQSSVPSRVVDDRVEEDRAAVV
jgi:hypothetical protein